MDNNLISYAIFEKYKNLLSFTTTRNTIPGDETPRFSDSRPNGSGNRKELADILKINPSQLVFPKQTHTDCVREIFGLNDEEPEDTDALVTDKKDICLCVQTADCVPLLMFDPENLAIAAVHAGWRGTIKNIAGIVLEKMKASFGSSPSAILVAIGPSISADFYDVGTEVVESVLKNVPNGKTALKKSAAGKWYLDLWEANRRILLNHGVLNDNIETARECTYSNPKKFFSARLHGINTGRLVSGIMLK